MPEDLLTMPDGDRFELVAGNLVERNMGAKSSYVAGRTHVLLTEFCDSHRRGLAFPEGTSYQCFPDDSSKVRRADVSFIATGRLPNDEPPDGHILIAPDLAVEVVSPNDLAYEIDEKVEEFLAAGVRLVWVVNPATRTVRVHRPDRPGITLRAEDELTGDDVLPGFRCRVQDLFGTQALSQPVPTS
ncbi:MAG: Uma2 family endonuclease [Planctomycetes bacterium]|nr:Uma2 family endonuclease [Planctomycetota bacterium]